LRVSSHSHPGTSLFLSLTVKPNGLLMLVWFTCCLLAAAEEEATLLALNGLSLNPTVFLAPIIFFTFVCFFS
jgi:hypothetical protein